jgi:hypothetical protein
MLGATINADILARRWPAEIGGAPSRFKWPRGRRKPAGRALLSRKQKPAVLDARTAKMTTCSTRRRRLAKQPPTFAEGRKIDAGGGKPSACSIAGPKSQGGILVAVGNPQRGIGFRIPPSRR